MQIIAEVPTTVSYFCLGDKNMVSHVIKVGEKNYLCLGSRFESEKYPQLWEVETITY